MPSFSSPKIILLLLAAALSGCAAPKVLHPQKAPAQTTSTIGSRLHGPGVSFWLAPPRGWVLDTGQDRGLLAVIYPEGSNFSQAEAVIFAQVRPQPADLTTEILTDKESIAQGSAVLVVSETEPQTTTRGRWVHIRIFEGAPGGPQARAYVEEPGGLVVLGLTCRHPQAFAWALEAFEELLSTYDQR